MSDADDAGDAGSQVKVEDDDDGSLTILTPVGLAILVISIILIFLFLLMLVFLVFRWIERRARAEESAVVVRPGPTLWLCPAASAAAAPAVAGRCAAALALLALQLDLLLEELRDHLLGGKPARGPPPPPAPPLNEHKFLARDESARPYFAVVLQVPATRSHSAGPPHSLAQPPATL